MAKRIFYTPVFSPGDNGWYCEVFDQDGKDLYTTEVHIERKTAVEAVEVLYPKAELFDL